MSLIITIVATGLETGLKSSSLQVYTVMKCLTGPKSLSEDLRDKLTANIDQSWQDDLGKRKIEV